MKKESLEPLGMRYEKRYRDEWHIRLLDELFQMERKGKDLQESNRFSRSIERMKRIFEEVGLIYHDPTGEPCDETRRDLEIKIAGDSTEDLVVKEVIKPIIRHKKEEVSRVIRKGIVVVESKNRKNK